MYDRRSDILAYVNREGVVRFSDLSARFSGVSDMTLRKDLKALDSEGRLVRVHGGARSLDTVADRPLGERMVSEMDKKAAIALKAARLARPGMTVFMDSGSTLTELAKVFPDIDVRVVTGGLSVAAEISRLGAPTVRLLGGEMNKASLSVRDGAAVEQIALLSFDLAFLSVNGYTDEGGFGCLSGDRWAMERAVLRRSARKVILMDSTKAGRRCPYCIAAPEEIDLMISDEGFPAGLAERLRARGVVIES